MANPKNDPYSPEAMRIRFHKLKGEIAVIEAKSAPIRAERDALAAEQDRIGVEMRTLADRAREIEAPLFEMKQQLSMLVKALGAKTGNPDGSMPEPKAPEAAEA